MQNETAAAAEALASQHRRRLRRLIGVMAAFYILLPLLLIYLLFKVFPPYPWPADPETNALVNNIPIYFLRGWIAVASSLEERLLLLVIAAGALGSFIHSATSFSSYVGNRQFNESWTLWYVLRPLIGVGLALVLYFATRGGLVLLINSGSGAPDASNINPFGVAAIAGLTGMFSKQAADKLADVFTTLFKSTADAERKDSLTPVPLAITKIDPPDGPTDGATPITISGTGFAAEATVLMGGQPATEVKVVNDTIITAKTPAHDVGKVDVDVVNADGKKTTKVEGYEYVAAGGANGNGASKAAGKGKDGTAKSADNVP